MVKLNKPKSWVFSGKVQDKGHLATQPQCAVCGRTTRYVFHVNHGKYDATVGPECVLNCSMSQEPGESQQHAQERVKAQINQYKKTARQKRLFSIILRIEQQEPQLDFEAAKTEVRKNHSLSPKHALFIMRLADKHGLNYGKDLIRISLNKQKHRDQYKNMPFHDRIELRQYVTTAQVGILDELDAKIGTTN
jgi:hypothetical protein